MVSINSQSLTNLSTFGPTGVSLYDDMTKHCPKCKQTLPLDNFVKNRSRRDGLDHYCKYCRLANVNRLRKNRQQQFSFSEPTVDFGMPWHHSFPMVGCYKTEHNYIESDKIVYVLVSCTTKEVLMVGQTTNWRERFSRFSVRDKHMRPLWVFMFEADSWSNQEKLYKDLIYTLRNKNIMLPWNKRDKSINN